MRGHVFMGLSGCGKPLIGTALPVICGREFTDGNVPRPHESAPKMSSAQLIKGEDRLPWRGTGELGTKLEIEKPNGQVVAQSKGYVRETVI